MEANSILIMLMWLGELTFASWLLSYGAEHLATRFGARFVGRTLLSVATTLPEIAIVAMRCVGRFLRHCSWSRFGKQCIDDDLGFSNNADN